MSRDGRAKIDFLPGFLLDAARGILPTDPDFFLSIIIYYMRLKANSVHLDALVI